MSSAIRELIPSQFSDFLESYLTDRNGKEFLKTRLLSDFTRRVLTAVCEIEWGEVITYRELAGRIGCPDSVRAVANALGRNPFPFVVPCHRVVRSDGAIGGYAWGTELKESLINYEKHYPKPINNQ